MCVQGGSFCLWMCCVDLYALALLCMAVTPPFVETPPPLPPPPRSKRAAHANHAEAFFLCCLQMIRDEEEEEEDRQLGQEGIVFGGVDGGFDDDCGEEDDGSMAQHTPTNWE